MKVCVAMFYDEPIKNYANTFYNVNKMYCEKYNIDIVVSHEKKYTNRKSHWERLPLIISILPNYDYVIWIDADAYFNLDYNILEIININNNVNFILSKDRGSFDKKNQPFDINTGVFIVKNTEYSITFLKKWAYDEEIFDYVLKKNRWNDQEALIYMLENNTLNIQQHTTILGYGILQLFKTRNNTYIHHLAGRDNKVKHNICNKYYLKLKENM
tara:strand:- start:2054 stop:2695 length:642 start_codon:yes stop_codon:yes gene_type:complete